MARRNLSPLEQAAVIAMHGPRGQTEGAISQLIAAVEPVLARAADREGWQYRQASDMPAVRGLATAIVMEWLHPASYWKPNGNPIAAAFARHMRCDRKTWQTTWHQHFEGFRGLPGIWLDEAEKKLT